MSPTIWIPIENGRQIAILAILSVGSSVSLALVTLRYFGRWKRQGKLDYGDLWVGLAELFLIAFHVVIFLEVLLGGLGLHQEQILARWGPQPIYTLYKLAYSCLVLVPALCFGKLSVLALYSQLMPFEEVKFWVKGVFAIAVVGFTAVTLTYLFMCSPVSLFWQSWDGRSVPGGHCGDLARFYFWTGLLNSLSDFSIVILPMPWLYKLRLPLREKLYVMGLFSFGIFIVAIAVVRQWYCTTLTGSGSTIDDFPYYGTWVGGLSSLEGTMTIAVACLPFIKPAFVGRSDELSPSRRSGPAADDDDGMGRGGSLASRWTRRWMQSLGRSSYKGIDSFATTTAAAATPTQDYELGLVVSFPTVPHRALVSRSRSRLVGGDDDDDNEGSMVKQSWGVEPEECYYARPSVSSKESPSSLVTIASVPNEVRGC